FYRPGQKILPRQDLVDESQVAGSVGRYSLPGVDDVVGPFGTDKFVQHEVHPVAGCGSRPKVAVTDDDVRGAEREVTQQRQFQPGSGSVDRCDRGHVEVVDDAFQQLDTVVVLLVHQVAVPPLHRLGEGCKIDAGE